MKSKVKLIYKTQMSYLPTSLPVNFYGLPDGKVYVVYSRFYEISFGQSGLEFVFATHEEFCYDFKKEHLYLVSNQEKMFPVFMEMVDKPDPKINIFKVYRNLNSYGEAKVYLNELAKSMRHKSKKNAILQ